MAVIDATNYPTNLFLFEDDYGIPHWYRSDPAKTDASAREEIDLADEMLAFFGHGNRINPVIFQVKGAKISRAEPFNMGVLETFRLSASEEHMEDMEGRVVEMLAARNGDSSFPLNAVVLDRDGSMLTQRTYNTMGQCSDGRAEHTLVVVKGPAVFTNMVEASAPEENPSEKGK